MTQGAVGLLCSSPGCHQVTLIDRDGGYGDTTYLFQGFSPFIWLYMIIVGGTVLLGAQVKSGSCACWPDGTDKAEPNTADPGNGNQLLALRIRSQWERESELVKRHQADITYLNVQCQLPDQTP